MCNCMVSTNNFASSLTTYTIDIISQVVSWNKNILEPGSDRIHKFPYLLLITLLGISRYSDIVVLPMHFSRFFY